jgi:uncharacterized protein YcgI (DUF1989 family)
VSGRPGRKLAEIWFVTVDGEEAVDFRVWVAEGESEVLAQALAMEAVRNLVKAWDEGSTELLDVRD